MTRDNEKKMISLELPQQLYQELRREAFDRELKISALVRDYIEQGLKKRKEGN